MKRRPRNARVSPDASLSASAGVKVRASAHTSEALHLGDFGWLDLLVPLPCLSRKTLMPSRGE